MGHENTKSAKGTTDARHRVHEMPLERTRSAAGLGNFMGSVFHHDDKDMHGGESTCVCTRDRVYL